MKKSIQTRPSASSRWTACWGSAVLEAQAEAENKTSAPALRGQQLHDEAFRYADAVPGKYDEDTIEAVRIANAIILDFLELPETFGEIKEFKEYRLCAPGFELIAGTGDRMMVAGKRALLIDYKFGSIYVDNDRDNTQTTIYLGHIAELFPEVEEFYGVIVQPARKNFPIPFVFQRQALLEQFYAYNNVAKILHSWNGTDPLPVVVGDYCKYCTAKSFCEVYMTSLGMKDLVVIGQQNQPLQSLPDADLVSIFKAKALVKKVVDYLDAVQEELAVRAEQRDIDGVEWGKGRGSRVWADPFSAATALEAHGVEPWKTEIISPHQAELRLREAGVKKKEIANLILSVEGKKKLVLSEGEEGEE